ncbi:hypothetical protein QTP88_010705 [Uroleucon formosanum]
MGGVDLMDSLIGWYRIIMRTKKWYKKIFYHLLDMTVVNSWLMYKKITGNTMPLAKFRESLSVTLMQSGIAKRGKGRPSGSLEIQENIKKKRTQTPYAPFDEIRRDCLEHWPNYEQQRRSCVPAASTAYCDDVVWQCKKNIYQQQQKESQVRFLPINPKVHFFSNSHLSIYRIVTFTYLWTEKVSLEFIHNRFKIARQSSVDRASFHREVVFDGMTLRHQKIGK